MARRGNKKRKHQAADNIETDGPQVPAPDAPDEQPALKRRKPTFDERWLTATRTPEAVLAAQMNVWSSEAYGHFDMPPEIVMENGVIKYRFWCRRHPDEHVTRARTDSSTSNLNSHIDCCDPQVVEGQGAITNFAHGSTYSKARFRYLTTVWVTTCFRPFAIVEDPPLQQMLKMLYAQVEIPSATTISRDVKDVFAIAKVAVAAYLQGQKGRIHIAFDGWTAPNVLSFLGVVVIFENKGELESFVLDFIRLNKSHTGKYLAEKMHECLEGFGISDKIYGQTGDNASNNDTMVEELGQRLNGRSGPHTRVRCLCHVLNLCVRAVLCPFVKPKSKKTTTSSDTTESDSDESDSDREEDEDPDEDTPLEASEGPEDDDELDMDAEANDEAELHNIVEENVAPVELAADQRIFARKTLTKVQSLTKRIFHSPVLREDLADLCRKHNIKPLGVVRAVATRWNSVAMTSKRSLYLRKPLQELVTKASHNTSRGPRLLRYKMSEEEWEVLAQLDKVLAYFLEATEHMSAKGRPLLHQVIPMIDFIENMLSDVSADNKYHPAVRVAASLGKTVLNKYYEKTDESVMYRMAIMLHPRYKTAYFKSQNWLQSWVDTALELLREEWEYYKPAANTTQVPDEAVTSAGLFAALNIKYASGGIDALEEYLISPPIPSVSDPIKHWHSLDSDNNPLARMALDVLSTPATSVDAERAFSRGGLTVSRLRRNLSDESTRAATVLSSWMKVPGLIPEGEVIQMFSQKASRLKAAQAGTNAEEGIVVE